MGMTDKREAEQKVTKELANHPKRDDDSHAVESSKQRRGVAEKELNESKGQVTDEAQ
jgi:hypothetical protein